MSTKPKTSSAPRPVPVPEKPQPRPEIVHEGKVGGPGSKNVQQEGWGGRK